MARRRQREQTRRTDEPTGSRLHDALAARFPGGLPAPPPPAPPPPRLVTEKELMAAAFAALATGEAIDFAAVRVVARLPRAPQTKTVLSNMPEAACPKERSMPAPTVAPAPNAPVVAALRERSWVGAGWRDEPGSVDARARGRELLARARRGPLPTLRIRGLRRDEALELVAAVVSRERAAGTRFLRIVTGKGLGSPGEPVLKDALAEWCASAEGEAHVDAWAPELDRAGEYGAVIVRLRPR
jgi:DNA-nicking Smr family endonuclease